MARTSNLANVATVSRATKAWYPGGWDFTNGGAITGDLVEYANNIARDGAQGLLVEEGSTNEIRNPRCEGAVAGTPGTPPTHMSLVGSDASVAGSGYENGWPYVDLEFSASGAINNVGILLEETATINATSGEAWTLSFGVRLVNGTLPDGFRLDARIRGVGGSFTESLSGDGFPFESVDGTHKRVRSTATLADGSTTHVTAQVLVDTAASGTFTLRIYAPQLEQKAYPTSPILPPVSSPAASDREPDDIEVANGAWSNDGGAGTLYVQSTLNTPYASENSGWLGAGYGADISNSIRSRAATSFSTLAVDGGVTQASMAGPTITGAGQEIKSAFAWNTDDFASSYNGETQQTDSSGSIGFGSAKLLFGIAGGSGQYPSQYVKSVRYWPRRLTNAELEALVGN